MRRIDEAGSCSEPGAGRTPEASAPAPPRWRERTVQVPPRLAGPPGTANGGIVVGLLASALGPRVEATLRRPTPVGGPLVLRLEEGAGGARAELRDPLRPGDEGFFAEARRASLRLPIPVAPDFEEARSARARAASIPHPFPHCFVCGTARPPGEGLRLRCGPLEGWGRHAAVAAPFVPDAGLVDRHGFVQARYLWAALDCPGAWAVFGETPRPLLLGRMTGALEARPRPGERCVAIGWRIGGSGRKHEAGTALLGAGGRVLGRARQIWIEPR